MNQPTISNIQTADRILTLVTTALNKNALSGLSEMLRVIAEAMNSYGCILWQVAPGADLNSHPPTGHLFVLAEWFDDEKDLIIHNMPLQPSIPGEAILTWSPVNVNDAQHDNRVYQGTNWLKSAGIKTICAIPIRFRDNAIGTVSLYRKTSILFSQAEIEEIKLLAQLVPDLYQAIQDRVSRNLTQRMIDIFHEADLRASSLPLSEEDIKNVFRRVCDSVAETFQCVEASIFLESPFGVPGKYKLLATTWPSDIHPGKEAYNPNEDEGLTSWVLANGKPVRIFDLAHFERDKAIIQAEYPELNWKDSWKLETFLRSFLERDPGSSLQPLSFMAAPVAKGEKVLGVIRCCTALKGPYYFAERELDLLRLVAEQISRFWNNLLTQRGLKYESESWQKLVRNISELNIFAQRELSKDREKPNEESIFKRALSVAGSVIAGADASDVRLLNKEKQELYLAATYGDAWANGDQSERERRLRRTYSVLGDATSAGAYVFKNRKVRVIPDVTKDEFYDKAITLGTTRAIIAPIQVGEQIVGVLDIRGLDEQAFPDYAGSMAELIGEQLGLYHNLAYHISSLNRAENERNQTFENLAHQLKGPITQLQARIHSVLWDDVTADQAKSYLQAARGLCGKAKRVTLSTELFAELAREGAIKVKPSNIERLRHDWIVKMLVEAASDNESILDPGRRIFFDVNRQSFKVLASLRVKVELALIEQAISCLLDNAGKYSYLNTKVEIFGGSTIRDEFFISVINRGLQISAAETEACKERGWRGEYAQLTTGEGSGIGLWVVDNIMKAHRGHLEIVPTTEGLTQVRLIFPASKKQERDNEDYGG